MVDDRSVPEDDFVDATMNRLDLLHDRSHVRKYRVSGWSRMLHEAGFGVHVIEPHARHRPLSSLTHDATASAAVEIQAIAASLHEQQRTAMNVIEERGRDLHQSLVRHGGRHQVSDSRLNLR